MSKPFEVLPAYEEVRKTKSCLPRFLRRRTSPSRRTYLQILREHHEHEFQMLQERNRHREHVVTLELEAKHNLEHDKHEHGLQMRQEKSVSVKLNHELALLQEKNNQERFNISGQMLEYPTANVSDDRDGHSSSDRSGYEDKKPARLGPEGYACEEGAYSGETYAPRSAMQPWCETDYEDNEFQAR